VKITTRVSTPIPSAAVRALEDDIRRAVAARTAREPQISRHPASSAEPEFTTDVATTTPSRISR
jgi:hypothetical protein